MGAFYFGVEGRRLFGCLHEPASGQRACGVVLCYPFGHEYIQLHRACRQLALHLSRAGFPVLRFDFFGSGDSEGEYEEAEINGWLDDLNTAIEEMKARCSVQRVALIGLRLGGALALLAGAGRQDVDSIVVWDLLPRGTEYVSELHQLHEQMLANSHVKPLPGETGSTEILGFPLAQAMWKSLEELDVSSINRPPARKILYIQTHGEAQGRGVIEHFQSLGVQVSHQPFIYPGLWTWVEDVGKMLVPRPIIEAVTSWLTKAYQ